jgi:hypothetical protein
MSHSVSLSWTASTDAVDGYQIFRGKTAGGEGATPINPALVTGTTYVDTGATPGEEFYVVKSSIGGVLSSASNEVSTQILPAPPTALTITASS